jgi:hypothetical protein
LGALQGTQETEIRRIMVQSHPRQIVCETLSRKPFTKIGLVEWLKAKALSSSLRPTKKKNYLVLVIKLVKCSKFILCKINPIRKTY